MGKKPLFQLSILEGTNLLLSKLFNRTIFRDTDFSYDLTRLFLGFAFSCIAFTFPVALKAQTDGQRWFQIFSPNTYELARYGDVPVNLSSGTPQVGVPLMNFSDRDINLDVSLSYNASGIRVDQEATWVGLGWSLNVGGVISRELRDKPDGFYPTPNLTFMTRTSITDLHRYSSSNLFYSQVRDKINSAVSSNGTDNGADIFYYNFNGRTGKFFLDANAKASFTKYEDFKVQMLTNNTFMITDEKGVVYEFSATEGTFDYSNGGTSYASAWYLTKIKSLTGAEITIEYVSGGRTTPSYNKRCYSQAYVNLTGVYNAIDIEYARHCVNYGAIINPIIPKKVSNSAGQYIDLVTSNVPRLDSEGLVNNQLDYVVLYDAKHSPIKKFKLNYSYFEANNNRKFPVTGPTDRRAALNYRLRLDSCQELSMSGSSTKSHRFEYFGDNDSHTDDVYTLPYRLSPSQDHWGYYNNANNNSIFPGNPSSVPFTQDQWMLGLSGGGYTNLPQGFTYSIVNGGNREPDIEASKAGALHTVHYPTGGYTKFSFESHEWSTATQYPMSGGLKVKRIESFDGVGLPLVKEYEYSPLGVSCEKCFVGTGSFYYTWYNQYIDVNSGEPGSPEFMAAFGIPSELTSARHVAKVESNAQLLLGSGMGAFYSQVTETTPGNGWTIYDYTYENDVVNSWGDNIDQVPTIDNDYLTFVDSAPPTPFKPQYIYQLSKSYCVFPFPNYLNNDWRRGHLLSKRVYAENGSLLSQDSIEYDIRALKAVEGYKTSKISEYKFIYARYYDVGGMVKPIREINRVYSADGSYVRTVKELDYSSTAHKLVTEMRTAGSDGNVVTTKFSYPNDYGNGLSHLIDRHVFSPIDVRSYKDGKLVSGEQISYGNNGLPYTVYQAEVGGATTDIPLNLQAPYTFSPKLINTYAPDNTLLTQRKEGGTPTTYVWGYNKTYPVAKIQNAGSNEVLYAHVDNNGIYYDHGLVESFDVGSNGGGYFNYVLGRWSGSSFSGNISLIAGKQYELIYWLQLGGDVESDLHIQGSHTVLSTTNIDQSGDGSWVRRRIVFTVPVNLSSLSFNSNGGFINGFIVKPLDSHMNTYTYKPLVGMTSMTDSKGMAIYYEYDSFGRLKMEKDHLGHIIKTYDYHYKP